jgi:hypothetical protein
MVWIFFGVTWAWKDSFQATHTEGWTIIRDRTGRGNSPIYQHTRQPDVCQAYLQLYCIIGLALGPCPTRDRELFTLPFSLQSRQLYTLWKVHTHIRKRRIHTGTQTPAGSDSDPDLVGSVRFCQIRIRNFHHGSGSNQLLGTPYR